MLDQLTTFDARSLLALAAAYEKLAGDCRARALDLESIEHAAAEGRRRVQEAFSSPSVVATYLAGGMPLLAALSATARAAGLPVDTVAHHWRAFLRARQRDAVLQRDALVMRLAAEGRSNDDISTRTGLHPVSVSRIVQKRWRAVTARHKVAREVPP